MRAVHNFTLWCTLWCWEPCLGPAISEVLAYQGSSVKPQSGSCMGPSIRAMQPEMLKVLHTMLWPPLMKNCAAFRPIAEVPQQSRTRLMYRIAV